MSETNVFGKFHFPFPDSILCLTSANKYELKEVIYQISDEEQLTSTDEPWDNLSWRGLTDRTYPITSYL